MPACPSERPLVSVILAAGKGTRMNAPGRHKVCFPLDGDTVIGRAVRLYAAAGAEAHYVVVGALAEQVQSAVATAPGRHVFCTQAEQRGTGNAARAAADALRAEGYDGDVLVVAGDKVLQPSALRTLVDAFHAADCDLAFITGSSVDFPTSGRVLSDANGHPIAIVEVSDIARGELLANLRRLTAEREVPAEEAMSLFTAAFPTAKKAQTALGPLWIAAQSGQPITTALLDEHFPDDGGAVTAANALEANLSVYLFRAPALYEALDNLTSNNAQREEYLTDAIGILARRGSRIITVPARRASDVMAFNTPEEYQRIVRHLEAERGAATQRAGLLRPVSSRLAELEAGPASLASAYGSSADLAARHRLLASALNTYLRRFGDEPVLVARAPGRLNIMGRHIDHQGGCGNFLAIDRDAILVIGARPDGRVVACNADGARFPETSFSIAESVSGYRGEPWLDYVNTTQVADRTAPRRGNWTLYLEAAIARLQAHVGDRPLSGMNIAAAGDIPMAAGLSSSSALVVAAAEGAVALNGIGVSPERFVDLCGEGEWYVGTRGGAGDHAAMKFARRGHAVQMGFLPFRVMTAAPLPEDHAFLICHSGISARKTTNARDAFNHRVACYHIGREMLKAAHPHLAARIQHLRDVNPEALDLAPADIPPLLKALPERMSRADVLAALPNEAPAILATHSDTIDAYPVRSIVLYGLAECERARACPDLLLAGHVDEFGRWMSVSHDGDRVACWRDGAAQPFAFPCSDADVDNFTDHGAPLAAQPGAYACSTEEIDRMVDIALAVPGVKGAQLSGAGLGGCIMVLAERSALPSVQEALLTSYYQPANLDAVMFPCHPVSGSGLLP